MATLPIVTYPKKILKQKAEEVLNITSQIKSLIPQMIETMYENEGIGLAAPQVGISKRIIIVETSDNPRAAVKQEKSKPFRGKPLAFLNPTILKKSGKPVTEEEGCLSLPGIFVQVKRSAKIALTCQTPEGKEVKIEAGGLIARIFQHEIDHLQGKLILDHLSPLLAHLKEQGILQSPQIIRAFSAINREDFVPPDMKGWAHLDEVLPLPSGQTISQPYVVAFMLEKLEPKEGQKILDIGSGSGWTTALLASLVGQKGKVIGIEVLPELKEFGERNVSKYNFVKQGVAEFICKNGNEGHAREAPYDGILVSASLPSKELPSAWKEQLKIGGKIVVPIQHSIWVFAKEDENHFARKEYPGFAFVPFI